MTVQTDVPQSSPGAVVGVDDIRRHFPALQRVEAGQAVAYFDGPGGTQVPTPVADALVNHLYHHNGNRKWAYPASAETDATVDGARATLADFFGCRPQDVVFGPNMTTLAYHLSRTLATVLQEGDEIVVTRLDHLANVSPWVRLAQEAGCTLREVPFHAHDGTLDMDAYASALNAKTRLVAVGWASNALGTVTDIDALVGMAREAGALTFVDAVHAAPHVLPDVDAMGCDFLACSPYKFYGPHAGVMFARAETLDDLDVPRLPCAPQDAPERFETGTGAFEDMAASAAAVDFLAGLAPAGPAPGAGVAAPAATTRRERLTTAFAALHHRGDELVRSLWDGLGAIPGVKRYGPAPGQPRTPTVGFTVEGRGTREVAAHLSENHGVFVSHGNFYAAYVTEDLGLPDGLVRAGCACYSTAEEVGRLVEGVAELA